MQFKCSNSDCNYSIELFNVKYTSKNGVLTPDFDNTCPECHSPLISLSNVIVFADIAVSQGKFNALSDADKKIELKKRAKTHFKKFDEDTRKAKRNDVINGIKEQFSNK